VAAFPAVTNPNLEPIRTLLGLAFTFVRDSIFDLRPWFWLRINHALTFRQ
jgi:hypothetical protein